MTPKVLFLIPHLANGGAQRAVTLWAQMLCNAGYAVTVATYYPLPNEYHLDPRAIRVNLLNSEAQYLQLSNKAMVCQMRLNAYLTEHPQDVILPFLIGSNLMTALCDQSHVRVTAQTMRNSPWDKDHSFDLILRDWAIQKQGSVILQNAEQMAYFNTPAFKHVRKYVVHNPLNPAITEIKKEHYGPIKKIVTAGRLVPQKNHALMIETIRILRDEFHENFCLDIYGTGELQDTLQAQIDKNNLGDLVKLCGRNNDIFHTIINYDLFLMTSLYEGTPNALLEAMGLGVPALAVKCRTGITELIDDGKNGYVLDSYDAPALANKIREINHPTQLAQIGKQARQDMTRYAPEKIQAELVTVIQDLMHNPPKIKNIPLKTALKHCRFQSVTDYQNYFEASLRAIKIADYRLGRQIFQHARRTLKGVTVNTPTATKKMYHQCLQANQFAEFYAYLQAKNARALNS